MIQTEPLRRFAQNLPSGWRTLAFSELLAEPVKNGVYKSKEFHGSGAKVVNMGELFAYNFINGQEMKRVELDERECTNYLLKAGDLLFARRSLVLEGSGKCSLVITAQEPTTFESSIIRARPSPKKADSRFLLYLFQSPLGRSIMAAISTRTAVSGIRASDLAEVGLPVPPIAEQRRIANILSTYDDLIENCQRRIQILEEMARRLYREWFVHFRYPGHESIPLAPSPLGPIPQGWELKGIKDIAQVTYGFAFKSQQFNTEGIGMPIVRIRDIPKGTAETYTDEVPHSKYHIRDGHILVGMDGDFHMCVWSAGPALQVQRVARFEPAGPVGNHLLYLLLERPIQDLNRSIVGTTVAHLGDAHIKEIQVPVPPKELLAKTNAVLEPFLEQITVLRKSSATLRRTRDLLLPRFFSGGNKF